MVINGSALLADPPITNMITEKVRANGVSHGLAEVGYDIRIKQEVRFDCKSNYTMTGMVSVDGISQYGRFCIASAMEEFDMPNDLVGIVHDKSTWAREGLSVFNTVIEPGFRGGLTLELVYHGQKALHIPAGSGIAQVIFHRISQPAAYTGKYQDQSFDPVPAIFA